MRSLFSSSPFANDFQAFQLGGARPPMMQGFLDDAEKAAEQVAGWIDDIIKDVPVGTLKSSYEKRRDDCLKENIIKRYDCLYELFQDIKREVRGDDDDKPPPKPTFTPPKKEEDTFPYLWVGLAGAGALALIYFITKK